MSRSDIRDIKIGLFFGAIILALVVLPILHQLVKSSVDARNSEEPFVLYFHEIQ